jgi:1-acyl-sn-glycerol-3-phosphate acyltransferase
MAPPGERVDVFYAALRLVARFWIWFLFRDVTVRGLEHVPVTGPVLLCVNHPNNLIDSLLVGATVPRPVHYVANSALFRSPLLAWLLRAAGAIPVHRRQDDPDRTDRNAEAFAACRRALEAGGVVAIYPEGTTHAEARVQRIRTGAARIALDHARGRGPAPPLAVVPVGLSFEARKAFGGRVLVAFGAPLPLAPHAGRAAGDPAGAVQALTAEIQAAMEREVVHVDRIDAADVVRAVEELYRDDLVRALRAERGLAPEAVDVFRLSRAIVEAVAHFTVRDPGRVARTWQRIQHYRARLAECRVRDGAVRAHGAAGEAGRPLRAWWQALLGLPVFLYGLVTSAVPYLLPRWAARGLSRKETDYATVRLLVSVVAFPLWWGLQTWVVWRAAGPAWAAAFAASLPVSGLAAYRYARGAGRLGARTRFAWLALTRRRAASRLLVERRAIVAELERARAEFLAATRGRAGPAGAPGRPDEATVPSPHGAGDDPGDAGAEGGRR